ncbi:MAG: LysR family transcriptional regulator [Planctomycetaceae bacterium]|nr:LysR family transcriptional regulator [Planctomycetaceae bacterium]
MDFKDLGYLVGIAEEMNLSRAAEKLIVDQSTLSKTLARLEAKAGQPLFYRTQAGLEITGAGTRFVAIARRLLKLKEEMDDEMRVITKGLAGRIHLGISYTFSRTLVPKVLPIFNQDNPGVEVIIHTETSALLEQMLLDGSLDVAVIVEPGKNRSLACETLFYEQILLAVSDKNPLSGQGEKKADEDFPYLSPKLLAGRHFILSQTGMRLRESAESFFKAENMIYDIAVTTASVATAMQLAAQDVGIAFIPHSYTLEPNLSPSLAFFCTDGTLADWRVCIAVKKKGGQSALIKRFVTSFKAAM